MSVSPDRRASYLLTASAGPGAERRPLASSGDGARCGIPEIAVIALLATLLYLQLFGANTLNPLNVRWMLHGDPAQHGDELPGLSPVVLIAGKHVCQCVQHHQSGALVRNSSVDVPI